MIRNRSPLTTTTEPPPITRRRTGFRPNNQPSNLPSKQSGKSKNEQQPITSNPLPKPKLPRTQGRWSYKTTPKPRIAIRKQVDIEEDQSRSISETSTTEAPSGMDDGKTTSASPAPTSTTSASVTSGQAVNGQRKIQEAANDDELDPSESEDVASVSVQDQHSEQQILPIETINVEISTVADMSNVYFEIATIKSPYTFQVRQLFASVYDSRDVNRHLFEKVLCPFRSHEQ